MMPGVAGRFFKIVFMGKVIGYLATWITYGTWLQGDERGFVKEGKILSGSKGLQQANDRRRTSDVVKLKKVEREVVRKVMLAEAERIGGEILGLSIWSNHVHLVVRAGGLSVEKVVGRLKSAAYYALRERGFKGRLWTRGCDKRYCFDEETLQSKVDYVQKHN